jgi:endo-1,4-beta-D-glucanase Y
MRSSILMATGAMILAASAVSSAGTVTNTPFVWYTEPRLKYPHRVTQATWDTALVYHWNAWKSRFVSNGLVSATTPSGTTANVSEAQSYGMLMAVWMNDQTAFNAIWSTTESQFWNHSGSTGKYYPWNISTFDPNYAGDADQDIAGALIFASALVDSGYWTDYTVNDNDYKAKAKILVQSIWTNIVDQSNGYQIQSWPNAGTGIRNPSYHMPAWYNVFQEFATANGISGETWSKVKSAAYTLLNDQPSASKGMARNFSSSTGGSPSGGSSSPNNYDMGFDAIRVPWRIGLDALWYKNDTAITWCENVWSGGVVDSAEPGMYTIGSLSLYGWGGGSTSPSYEQPMTTAMWGVSALGASDSSVHALNAFNTIQGQLGNWGLSSENYFATYTIDSTSPSQMKALAPYNYYAQSLEILGALAMAGRAPNVWGDLMDTWVVPDTSSSLTTGMTVKLPHTTYALIDTDSVTISGTFNKATDATLKLSGNTSKAWTTFTLTGVTSFSDKWLAGYSKSIAAFSSTGETVTAVLSWPGTPTAAGVATTKTDTVTFKICNSNACATTGVANEDHARYGVRVLADGMISISEAQFLGGGEVRVNLRNAAGVSLYRGTLGIRAGAVTVPSLRLAPGWYAAETELDGVRSVRSFALGR